MTFARPGGYSRAVSPSHGQRSMPYAGLWIFPPGNAGKQCHTKFAEGGILRTEPGRSPDPIPVHTVQQVLFRLCQGSQSHYAPESQAR